MRVYWTNWVINCSTKNCTAAPWSHIHNLTGTEENLTISLCLATCYPPIVGFAITCTVPIAGLAERVWGISGIRGLFAFPMELLGSFILQNPLLFFGIHLITVINLSSKVMSRLELEFSGLESWHVCNRLCIQQFIFSFRATSPETRAHKTKWEHKKHRDAYRHL